MTTFTKQGGRRAAGRAALALAALAAVAGLMAAAYAHGQSRASRKAIVGVFGVGGILTDDGALWQYRPKEKDWVTIDQAFGEDGRETRILPLPVAGREVAFLESFGFLVTRSGECWLYDLENDRWDNIGNPEMGGGR
jgi:hypothetical protein